MFKLKYVVVATAVFLTAAFLFYQFRNVQIGSGIIIEPTAPALERFEEETPPPIIDYTLEVKQTREISITPITGVISDTFTISTPVHIEQVHPDDTQ